MLKVVDYLGQFNRRLVSPIWGGPKDFDFLCAGHLGWSEALGFELYQATPLLVQVTPGQITSEDDLAAHTAAHPFDEAFLEREVAAIPGMRAARQDPANQVVPGQPGLLGGGTFGPLTVVSDILGAENLLRDTRRSPTLVHSLLERTTCLMCRLAQAECEAGVDFFWVAEPVASLLSPRQYWEFCGQYLQRIFASTPLPGFLHVCGKTDRQTADMVRTGAQVLSIDSVTSMAGCLHDVPAEVVMMGNVDPALLHMGSAEDARAATAAVLEAAGIYPNFILSTGCATQDGTPRENVDALIAEGLAAPMPSAR